MMMIMIMKMKTALLPTDGDMRAVSSCKLVPAISILQDGVFSPTGCYNEKLSR